MKKRFITNLGLLILLNLLIKPFWIFGIDRSVQNIVGTENYGYFFSLFSLSILLNIILDFGITNYNNRTISQHNQLISKLFPSIIILKLFLSVIYIFVCLITAFIIGYNGQQIFLLIILACNQIIASYILYLRSNISGMHYYRTDSLISVLDRTLMIIICSILLWGEITPVPFRIEWFVYAQTTSYLVSCIITLFVVFTISGKLTITFDKLNILIILKQCLPYTLLGLLMAIYYRIDSVLLERLLPDGKIQAGIYAQAFRITDAFSQFAFLFASLLLPMYSNIIKQKSQVLSLTTLATKTLMLPAFILSVIAIIYKQQIINLLYDHHTNNAGTILAVLFISFLFICISYIYGTLLTANGNLKELNIIAIITVLFNIFLNLLLIPSYKALGSAIAALISQSISTLMQFFLINKIFNIPINKLYLLQISSFIILLISLAILINHLISQWIIGLFIIILSGIILAIILRLIRIKDYQKILFPDIQ